MGLLRRGLALCALCLFSWAASAEEPAMLVVQSPDSYPEAMMKLQRAIEANGYRFSRVQRIDYGLRKRGYDIPPYRIVFFGKPDQIRFLSVAKPELLPFLPLKIIIYQEHDRVTLLAASPSRLAEFYKGQDIAGIFASWDRDIRKILADASRSE